MDHLKSSDFNNIINSDSPKGTRNYAPDQLELIAIKGIPQINRGDNISELIWQSLLKNNIILTDGDVLVVAQKIISKAEGRMVRLNNIVPSEEAQQLADETGKDARLVQLILNESTNIIRKKNDTIIVEHRLGLVMAQAGIDQSNVPPGYALLLPEDPDQSAKKLRDRLIERSGKHIAVIISDSISRAWRKGTVGHTIGVAGLVPLVDMRGQLDMLGRPFHATEVAVADAVTAAATLLMGEASEAKPVVLVRGYVLLSEHVGVKPLLREKREDLFR
ncbi:coenzyme F420:L-glutamate ligase [Tolypothrix sp. NIES-4075]|uniref:coenzyme F420-0:L-glutamate ligase n=1 Tax=Tolypothrix sp. NIES-4075 TaxID=2005459 RepID=UPI000B6EA87C|nr:coenzyme F420-0:L-glutamate ligase [Tolypothrix sp. NIES-4075]GAX44322.1 coenzyme F420:L-glutamate ligase [Tolypothrix sp. NIES-4075]